MMASGIFICCELKFFHIEAFRQRLQKHEPLQASKKCQPSRQDVMLAVNVTENITFVPNMEYLTC